MRHARFLVLLPMLALTACGGGHRARVSAAGSSAARAAPAAPAADVRAQSRADDAFAGRLYATLAPDPIDRSERLVLVNAVYLKAEWATPFDAGLTGEAPFHAPGGDVTARFMHDDHADLAYLHGDGYQAVELPYKGDELAMDLLLPD